MSTPKIPRGLDPNITSYEVTYELEAESLGFMLKRGTGRGFTLFSDEPPEALGGDGSAPQPLYYFTMGLMF
ncbi:MAG: hypothetical protein ACE5IG_02430 [Dehalococcoidia bacterium]